MFRFNREFYELDERGRPIGHRNLDVLAERVSSVMLRRRKEDVESQLPGRTTKTFFVPMTNAQLEAYDGYEFLARRLAAVGAKRPLTREEFKMLQGHLACMRMICDTPYILDGRRHDCPKMEEAVGCLAASVGEPEPEDAEAAAAYLLEQDFGTGALPLGAVRVLSGDEAETGPVAPVRELVDAASRCIEDTAAASRRLSSR